MSSSKKIFGGKSKKNTPSVNEAIDRLKEIGDLLEKKQNHLESKIKEELIVARATAKSNKTVALLALSRKRRYEKELEKICGTLSTVESQRITLENATTNTEVLKTMDMAAKAMKATNAELQIDNVDALMDDLAEQHQLADEVSESLSRPVGFGSQIDESELEHELEELQQEALDKELLEIPAGPSVAPSLPSPPREAPKKSKPDSDEDVLRELAQWSS